MKPIILSTFYVLCNALFKSFRHFFAWRPTLEFVLQTKFHLYTAFAARCRSLANWCGLLFLLVPMCFVSLLCVERFVVHAFGV